MARRLTANETKRDEVRASYARRRARIGEQDRSIEALRPRQAELSEQLDAHRLAAGDDVAGAAGKAVECRGELRKLGEVIGEYEAIKAVLERQAEAEAQEIEELDVAVALDQARKLGEAIRGPLAAELQEAIDEVGRRAKTFQASNVEYAQLCARLKLPDSRAGEPARIVGAVLGSLGVPAGKVPYLHPHYHDKPLTEQLATAFIVPDKIDVPENWPVTRPAVSVQQEGTENE